ncbi:MAG: thioesterase family protein [Verrucomicrobiota bacterium]
MKRQNFIQISKGKMLSWRIFAVYDGVGYQAFLMEQVKVSEMVMFYDTDCGGVVSNIAYLRFVEKARTALFESLGMPAKHMNETKLFPAVVRTEIDYQYPARLGDSLTIKASLAVVEKVKATCAFELTVVSSDEAGKLAAKAVQTVVLVQMPSGRPTRMPEEWRTA